MIPNQDHLFDDDEEYAGGTSSSTTPHRLVPQRQLSAAEEEEHAASTEAMNAAFGHEHAASPDAMTDAVGLASSGQQQRQQPQDEKAAPWPRSLPNVGNNTSSLISSNAAATAWLSSMPWPYLSHHQPQQQQQQSSLVSSLSAPFPEGAVASSSQVPTLTRPSSSMLDHAASASAIQHHPQGVDISSSPQLSLPARTYAAALSPSQVVQEPPLPPPAAGAAPAAGSAAGASSSMMDHRHTLEGPPLSMQLQQGQLHPQSPLMVTSLSQLSSTTATPTAPVSRSYEATSSSSVPRQPPPPPPPQPAAAAAAAAGVLSSASSSSSVPSPRALDFICDRGIAARDHGGNRLLRSIVTEYLQRYRNAGSSKQQKRKIQREIVRRFKQQTNGRFLTKDKKLGRWVMVDDEDARIKVGQQLRYQLRRQEIGQQDGDEDDPRSNDGGGDASSSGSNNSLSSLEAFESNLRQAN